MKKINYVMDYSFKTDVGRVRLVNEDQATIITNSYDDVLMLVADGMGGHNRGDYASRIAIDMITDEFNKIKKGFFSIFFARVWLNYVINKVNKFIYTTSENSTIYKGMGTTIVAVLICKKNILSINVGDSRAYIYSQGSLHMISEDQSYVDYLKRSGQISEKEAIERKDKNVLLNALGIYPSINYNIKKEKYDNSPIILCSDGFYNNLNEYEIVSIIKKDLSAADTVKEFINTANSNGGSDNIGVCYFKRTQK